MLGGFNVFLLFPVEGQVPLKTDSEDGNDYTGHSGSVFSLPHTFEE